MISSKADLRDIPRLLDPGWVPDPSQAKRFWEYLHRWRVALFHCWIREGCSETQPADLARLVDHLLGTPRRYERGIHYTPAPIVDYLVNTILDRAFAGRSIDEIKRLRILDPSCGCGTFLIAALRYVLRLSNVRRFPIPWPMTEQQRRLCEMIGNLARQAMHGDDMRTTREQIDTLANRLFEPGD